MSAANLSIAETLLQSALYHLRHPARPGDALRSAKGAVAELTAHIEKQIATRPRVSGVAAESEVA